MADTLTIEIPISDINKDIAIPAFLASTPMPQIPDPDWVDDGTEHPLIDEYTTPKKWVQADGAKVLKAYYLRQINKGIVIQNESVAQAQLTEL